MKCTRVPREVPSTHHMSFMNSSSIEIPFGLDRRRSSLREEVIAYIYQSGTFKLAYLLSYHLVISLPMGWVVVVLLRIQLLHGGLSQSPILRIKFFCKAIYICPVFTAPVCRESRPKNTSLQIHSRSFSLLIHIKHHSRQLTKSTPA